jgi:hypothetical protein
VDLGDPDALAAAQERAPLAAPSRSGTLDVSGAINPVYTSRVQALWTRVVEPLRAARAARLADAASAGDGVSAADDADATGDRAAPAHPARGADGGRTAPGQYSDAGLSQAEWARIQDELAPYEAWLSAKAGANVELLGAEVLRGLLAPRLADAICALIETSRETAIVLDNLRLVEKLILYQANIIRFANNFVSFPDLYARGRRTLFDLGDLVMDGRRFNLAVRVGDRAEHVKMARSGNIYVLYVEVTGRNEDPYQVAVAVTSGGRGNLVVGKRGVFRQRDGSERDARIVEVIESPISLGEAIAAPFRRIAKAITGQIESIAGTAEKQLDKASASAIPAPGEGGDKGASGEDSAGGKDGADAKPASQSASSPPTQGGVTARGALTGGVAIAAMGSALAYVTETLSQLSRWQIASGVGGAIAAVIIPTIVLALLKLRSRDLSAILEGSGWAINARMRLTYRQSYYLTERPPYPTTARGLGRRWIKWALIALVLASLAIAGWRVVRARWGDKPQTQPAAPTAPATPSAPAAPPGP